MLYSNPTPTNDPNVASELTMSYKKNMVKTHLNLGEPKLLYSKRGEGEKKTSRWRFAYLLNVLLVLIDFYIVALTSIHALGFLPTPNRFCRIEWKLSQEKKKVWMWEKWVKRKQSIA